MRSKEEIFYYKDGETLEKTAQRNWGCPIPGRVQDQVGWGLEQLEGVPAHGRRNGMSWFLKFFSTQPILWVCNYSQPDIFCAQKLILTEESTGNLHKSYLGILKFSITQNLSVKLNKHRWAGVRGTSSADGRKRTFATGKHSLGHRQ